MPDINSSTPREDYTIAGKTFSIVLPYVEGHTLTGNEAATLNQTWAENARNNFAKRVKEAEEAGTFDQDMLQSQLDDYLSEYEFGVRIGGGGRVGDPVLAEAISIAKDQVRKALLRKGAKLKDYSAKDITAYAKGILDRGDAKSEAIRALAKQRVDAAKEIDDEVDVTGLEPAPISEGESAPAPKAKKGATAEAA